MADFVIPGDDLHAFRVQFEGQTIVRLLDEMPLSTEHEDTANEGLVSEHFAYQVEGAVFANTQSQAFKQPGKSLNHYRFITGWGCLDVLTGSEPLYSIVDKAPSPPPPKMAWEA
jgi:hypothetical protein